MNASRDVADAVHKYVLHHPRKLLGIAASAGLMVGYLLSRSAHASCSVPSAAVAAGRDGAAAKCREE